MPQQHSTYSSPKVAVLAVTYKDDQLILVQRKNEPQKGGWGFPGGSVWPGESLRDAAVRELKEETSVSAVAEQLLEVVEVNEFDGDNCHHHFILVPVLCRYVEGDLQPGDDASDCCWMSVADIVSSQSDLIEKVADVALKAQQRLSE
ncbi:NUDIX domain-containing protein [Photobacterium halotolerans]|uniref:NUDIX hydrolase n=1 Tax=Photobacterium halotolerans TaxID=265726 RepID=UPI001372F04D|nr:NUDIX hydrolase [Photobacterium halotolerans]NAX49418.1 NUDIX domain-containing protein [Photobacterium halotolerans]